MSCSRCDLIEIYFSYGHRFLLSNPTRRKKSKEKREKKIRNCVGRTLLLPNDRCTPPLSFVHLSACSTFKALLSCLIWNTLEQYLRRSQSNPIGFPLGFFIHFPFFSSYFFLFVSISRNSFLIFHAVRFRCYYCSPDWKKRKKKWISENKKKVCFVIFLSLPGRFYRGFWLSPVSDVQYFFVHSKENHGDECCVSKQGGLMDSDKWWMVWFSQSAGRRFDAALTHRLGLQAIEAAVIYFSSFFPLKWTSVIQIDTTALLRPIATSNVSFFNLFFFFFFLLDGRRLLFSRTRWVSSILKTDQITEWKPHLPAVGFFEMRSNWSVLHLASFSTWLPMTGFHLFRLDTLTKSIQSEI